MTTNLAVDGRGRFRKDAGGRKTEEQGKRCVVEKERE
jgi:hypothetical protein